MISGELNVKRTWYKTFSDDSAGIIQRQCIIGKLLLKLWPIRGILPAIKVQELTMNGIPADTSFEAAVKQ